jgi:acetyltransferase
MTPTASVSEADTGERWWLPDIGRVAIRPLSPADRCAYYRFCARLTREDLRLRFCGIMRFDAALARRLLAFDPAREAVFAAYAAAEDGAGDAILGIARLARVSQEEAEIALVVRSDRKRRGLGRVLLRRLIFHGAALGLRALSGDVLDENYPARLLVRNAGFVGVGPVGIMRHFRLALPGAQQGPSVG